MIYTSVSLIVRTRIASFILMHFSLYSQELVGIHDQHLRRGCLNGDNQRCTAYEYKYNEDPAADTRQVSPSEIFMTTTAAQRYEKLW